MLGRSPLVDKAAAGFRGLLDERSKTGRRRIDIWRDRDVNLYSNGSFAQIT
jgi:hypothetical protein